MILTKDQQSELLEASKPLIKWLNDNCHPHVIALVDTGSVQITEGICIQHTDEFIKGRACEEPPEVSIDEEDPYRAISSLKDGQMWTWPKSDYGRAEVWRTGLHYILFEIPEFGGETMFSQSYPIAAIDRLIADVNTWT